MLRVLQVQVPSRCYWQHPQRKQILMIFSHYIRIEFLYRDGYPAVDLRPFALHAVPSSPHSTLLDNFGTRRLLQRPNQHSSSTTHMSQHRSGAKQKQAFDKESLLDQLRKEKIRSRKMNASSGFLKRQLSHSKQTTAAVVHPSSHHSI